MADIAWERSYVFHGVPLTLTADHALVGQAVDRRLRRFRVADGKADDHAVCKGPARLRASVTAERSLCSRPRGAGRPVYERAGGEVSWFADDDILWLDNGDGLTARCEPSEGVLELGMARADPEACWLASHGLFTIPLIEMLKRCGLYSLHAGAVSSGGKALLLAGASGSGKTTLSISLAHAGLALLADDMVFLREGVVWAFPDEVDLATDAAKLLPWLAPRLSTRPPPGSPKWALDAECLVKATALNAGPSALVFPTVTSAKCSSLTPLDSGQALMRLLPNVLLTEQESTKAHIAALAGLAGSSRCYSLSMGPLDEAVDLLAELVA